MSSLDNMLHQPHHHRDRIDKALVHANAARLPHDYAVNEEIYKKILHKSRDKAKPVYSGPQKIVCVHTDNTVTIRLNDDVTEQVSI